MSGFVSFSAITKASLNPVVRYRVKPFEERACLICREQAISVPISKQVPTPDCQCEGVVTPAAGVYQWNRPAAVPLSRRHGGIGL